MTGRKMTQPKTILKNIMEAAAWPSDARKMVEWSDEQIAADLADYAEQMWHNQYVAVDVSRVTPSAFRTAAVKREEYLKELWAGEPEEFM